MLNYINILITCGAAPLIYLLWSYKIWHELGIIQRAPLTSTSNGMTLSLLLLKWGFTTAQFGGGLIHDNDDMRYANVPMAYDSFDHESTFLLYLQQPIVRRWRNIKRYVSLRWTKEDTYPGTYERSVGVLSRTFSVQGRLYRGEGRFWRCIIPKYDVALVHIFHHRSLRDLMRFPFWTAGPCLTRYESKNRWSRTRSDSPSNLLLWLHFMYNLVGVPRAVRGTILLHAP